MIKVDISTEMKLKSNKALSMYEVNAARHLNRVANQFKNINGQIKSEYLIALIILLFSRTVISLVAPDTVNTFGVLGVVYILTFSFFIYTILKVINMTTS